MSSESVDRSDDLRIAMIVSSFLACTLHTIGFWALWNVKHKNIFIAIERLYLLNLSVAENIHSSFLALSNILFLYKYDEACLLYTSPSPRDKRQSRMPSSA